MKKDEQLCDSCKIETECEEARHLNTEEGEVPVVIEECSEYQKR